MIAELRLDAAQRGTHRRPHARRSQLGATSSAGRCADSCRWPPASSASSRCTSPEIDRASGHFDANLELRRHARRAARQRRHQALRRGARPLPAQSRIARGSRWKRASSPTISSSAPRRKAGAGTLASSGKIEWREGLPYGDIHLDGENLRLVDVPEARIDASPDLDFRIAGARHLRQGRGQTTAGAHRSPPISPTPCCPPPTRSWSGPPRRWRRIRSASPARSRMTLGDKVTIETYGLSGHVDRQHHRAHAAWRADARHRRVAGARTASTRRWRASSTSSAAGSSSAAACWSTRRSTSARSRNFPT